MKARQEAKELFQAMLQAIEGEDNIKKAKRCALIAIEAQKDALTLATIAKHQERQSPAERIEAVRREIVNL